MKTLLLLVFTSMIALTATAQNKSLTTKPDPSKKVQVVDAACGQCQLRMHGRSCDLAVRIEGKVYFVEDTDIHSYGDAHSEDGLCNTVRKAEVQGQIVNNRFKASYFRILESPKKRAIASR